MTCKSCGATIPHEGKCSCRPPVSGEPRTKAGRALLFDPDEGYPEGLEEAMGPDATKWRDSLRDRIRAIEAEASTGAALDEDDLRWRALIWLNHGHDGLYGDDGEMQCPHSPPTDFLRHPIDHIEDHLTRARLAEQEGDR